MGDERTLRLAKVAVTPGGVQALLRYQREVAKALADPAVKDWPGRVAFAHSAGLKAAGLDPLDVQKLSVAAAEFCGRRWQVRRLGARLAEAKAKVEAARAAGQAPPAREEDLAQRLPKELQRLEDLSALEALHGPGSVDALRAHEAELLALHETLAHLEGKGHLHPQPTPRA